MLGIAVGTINHDNAFFDCSRGEQSTMLAVRIQFDEALPSPTTAYICIFDASIRQ